MVQQQDREALTKAVTPEKLARAKTYDQYVASISQNREKFADNLAKATVPDEYAGRLRALAAKPSGPARLLVIGEDWCPDVYRGMPVAKRIADAAGLEMRVLERDQHLDVAEHFKKDGQFLSIPVLIFLTGDGRYITHWIERPSKANDEMREALSPIFGPAGDRQLTEKLGRAPTAEEKDAARVEAQRRYDEFQASSPYWARWREYTVREVTDQLEQEVE